MPVPSQGITVFTVFRLLTDFVCLYTYEFWLSLCKIARSSVILLLPLSTTGTTGTSRRRMVKPTWRKRRDCHQQSAFADYVTEYWVEVNNRQQWHHFDTEDPRTNNHLEGWHGKSKKHLIHSHPNIFVLIELLQKTQANTSKPDTDIGRRHAT